MIKNFLKRMKYLSKKLQYQNSIPLEMKHDDIYIVEFPKSGITWLSTIIGTSMLKNNNQSMQATFYNIQQIIPDIHMSKELSYKPIWNEPNYRIIKSHSTYCPFYNHVIYLIRHPKSVMNSYYKYRQGYGQFDGTFSEFIRSDKFGIDSWVGHVESWIMKSDSSKRVHLIRYEDLKEEPHKTIENLFKNLGVLISSENINKAIELSNFESMKKNETIYKENNPNRKLSFVRKGNMSNEIDISKDDEKYIQEKTNHILERFYK